MYLTLPPHVRISIFMSSTSISFLCPSLGCFGCWEFSSFLDKSWDPLSQYFLWIRTTFFEAVLWKVCEAVMAVVAQVDSHFLFLLPALGDVFQWACQRMSLFSSFLDLEHVALYIGLYWCFLVFINLLQEADVVVFDTAGFECFPNSSVCGVGCLREIDCCCPHFDTPLVTLLLNHSVRRKVVSCLVWASESCLIFRLFLVKLWIQSSVQFCREQFVQRWQWAFRAVASNIFHISFLV